MSGERIAWAHNWETSGQGTVPVVVYATAAELERTQGDPDDWHIATDDEVTQFEDYWARVNP